MKRDSRGNVIQPATPVLNKILPSASSSASASAAAAAATEDLRTGEYEQEMKRRRLGKTTIVKDIYNQLCECFKRCYERFFQKELPSASSSSSVSASAAVATEDLPIGEYEVFLSFRGADTRDGFTDFLYTYLHGAGVRTFRDDNELRVGEEIGPELLRAIKGSKISIPIFSKGYASSKWCLRELAQMVECRANSGQIIYPIFYDVEPSEVQHYKRGSYKEAFLQYEKSKSLVEATVQQWEAALEIVGELKGLELKKETNGREGELVKRVVEMVLLKLKKNYTHVPDNLVGMEEHIKEMERLLNVGSDGVRIVGIHGLGGLGKTTIAKVIYNQFCERFEHCCFLDDVRENWLKHNGIVELQKKLLSKLIRNKIADDSVGIDRIKDAIHGKKVFIVLDDIEEKSQFDSLAGSSNWFASGSRIIVTTRNKKVLDSLEAVNLKKGILDVFGSYEPPVMEPDVSLQLFSKYAFMRDSPDEGYDSLAEGVVSVAAGLPLVLVTIGSSLFGVKDKALWEEKRRELQEIPDEEVLHKLKISVDALTPNQKEIFLDIACLFIGYDKTYPCYMWDECGFYPGNALNVLVQRSLIKIGGYNTFKMHDQLRDLGRYLVREGNLGNPERWSRLWNTDKAWEVYENGQGSEIVEALCLSRDLPWWSFQAVPWSYYVGEKFVGLSNLRILSLDNARLDGDFKHCLPNLRWLKVHMLEFTATNFHLRNIVILDLSAKNLNVKDGWDNLWTEIQKSKKLKVLSLRLFSNLRSVPCGSSFSKLERLVVHSCCNLTNLDGIEELESLRYLQASICYGLKTLPNLSRLRNLEELDLSDCDQIEEILGLDKLESLEHLKMSRCGCLKRLPDLSNLKKLKKLVALRCNKLIEIQGLPDRLGSLEILDISSCYSLKRLPNLSNLKRLKELYASEVTLTEIRGLVGLESLEILYMNGCEGIERIFGLSKLKRLTELQTENCPKLIEIQGLEGLESLESLNMGHCKSIERLPDLSSLKSLKRLDVSSCGALIQIQGLEGLESLEHLRMGHCKSIERLPDLSSLKNLKRLYVPSCVALINIQGLHRLESLEYLDMMNCESLEKLPDLPNFGVLKEINISGCSKLHEVEGLRVVESLEGLYMSDCQALGEIIELSNLKNLKILHINSLPKLNEIRGLEELESLERLSMNGCKSIESLPDFSNLKKLIEIDATDCETLTEIRGLDELESLTALWIRGCVSLKNLPSSKDTSICRDYSDEGDTCSLEDCDDDEL